VDIGFHYGGIHTQFAATGDFLFERDFHHALMEFSDHFRTQLARQPSHGFVIWNRAATDAREFAVHQVGAHFARQILKAPVAKVLQQQHAQDNLGGGARTPTGLALLTALSQFLLDDRQQGFVIQRLICVPHPGFPQIADRLGDQAIGKAALLPVSGDHAFGSFLFDASRSSRSSC
jgi:hypothetical protein